MRIYLKKKHKKTKISNTDWVIWYQKSYIDGLIREEKLLVVSKRKWMKKFKSGGVTKHDGLKGLNDWRSGRKRTKKKKE